MTATEAVALLGRWIDVGGLASVLCGTERCTAQTADGAIVEAETAVELVEALQRHWDAEGTGVERRSA